MIAALALLVFAQAAPAPGLVVLLGEHAQASDVPELALDERPRALLYAGEGAPDVDEPRPGECAQACFHLSPERFRDADEPRLVEWTRSASRVAFTTGTLHEWFEVLYPRGDAGELVAAVREAWRAGALVVGRGDRAALLCGACVIASAGELAMPECDPHDLDRPRTTRGLALADLAALDTDRRSAGRFERLLRVLAAENHDVGVWLDDRSALIADSRAGSLRCRGDYALLLDLRRAHKSANAFSLRLSILRDGDAWTRRRGAVELAQARQPAQVRDGRVELELNDVFATDELVHALAALGREPKTTIVVRDALRTLELTLDDDSRVARDERGVTSWVALRAELTGFDARAPRR